MTNGNWSRSERISLAGVLFTVLAFIAIFFAPELRQWLGLPVERMRDQQSTSQTPPPDDPRTQTPPPDNPTTQNRNDQKQPHARTKAEYDAYMAVFNERDPKKRIELARKFIHDYPESDLKDYAIQIAGPSDRPGISGPVYRLDEGVSPPSILYRVEPGYSEEARKANIQGVVVLSAIVRKDGNIEIVKVVRGLGYGLDENGISALKQWKFRPGMMNGVPVDVALNVEVNFSLR